MQDVCLLLSLTGSPLQISLLPSSTTDLKPWKHFGNYDSTGTTISKNEYSNSGWALR